MQLHALSEQDIAGIVVAGEDSSMDPQGRSIFSVQGTGGKSTHVVIALDDPDLVIAVICETAEAGR